MVRPGWASTPTTDKTLGAPHDMEPIRIEMIFSRSNTAKHAGEYINKISGWLVE
jgi:hypothetical protein